MKKATYTISDAMCARFIKWTKDCETSNEEARVVSGPIRRSTARFLKWMRDEGYMGEFPLFEMLREVTKYFDSKSMCPAFVADPWRDVVAARLLDCIQHEYRRHKTTAEAVRSLLRECGDEIESIVKGGE